MPVYKHVRRRNKPPLHPRKQLFPNLPDNTTVQEQMTFWFHHRTTKNTVQRDIRRQDIPTSKVKASRDTLKEYLPREGHHIGRSWTLPNLAENLLLSLSNHSRKALPWNQFFISRLHWKNPSSSNLKPIYLIILVSINLLWQKQVSYSTSNYSFWSLNLWVAISIQC